MEILTPEKVFEYIDENYKYIARDEDESWFAYENLPARREYFWATPEWEAIASLQQFAIAADDEGWKESLVSRQESHKVPTKISCEGTKMKTDIQNFVNTLKLLLKEDDNISDSHPAIGKICLVRAYGSGVHYGLVEDVQSNEGRSRIVLKNCRRIWYWEGAFTLSKIATNGLPFTNQKLSCVLPEEYIEDVIELIPLEDKIVNILDDIPTHIGEYEKSLL